MSIRRILSLKDISLYAKTSDVRHIEFVRDFHSKMYNSSLIEERTVDNTCTIKSVPSGFRIPKPGILFERIDKKTVEEEVAKLRGQVCVSSRS